MNRTLQVYKFGGASVKDAAALLNLHTILHSRLQSNKLIVVSAMGKTTNALEAVLAKKLGQADFSQDWKQIKDFHVGVCQELFPDADLVVAKLEQLMDTAKPILEAPISKRKIGKVY
jgi:aspartate kinase